VSALSADETFTVDVEPGFAGKQLLNSSTNAADSWHPLPWYRFFS
jgi:hypothetical protein